MLHNYALGVLGVSWAFWFWETYLDYRQYRVYKKTDKVPKELEGKIDDETFRKSKAYSIDKARFGFISSIFSQIQSTVIICFFLMANFWNLSHIIMKDTFGLNGPTKSLEWEIFQSLTFTFITSLVTSLIGLPLSIYNTFVIEERHGFNKQTAAFFAWDKLKAFVVSFLITAPILSGIIYIVRNGGPYFFLIMWAFCFVVVIILTFFTGEIMGLFDTFTPLPPGELRDRIVALAEGIGFPLMNIFVVEGSKRSSHSNAYQAGIFNRKRIVIYDTLIENYYANKDQKPSSESNNADVKKDGKDENAPGSKADNAVGCNNDEILAVLCHELGHWHCSHLIKRLIFTEVHFFFVFLIFSYLYTDPTLYAAFGFGNEMPAMIGLVLLMLLLTPYSELQGFISTLISRKFEYEADHFAVKMGHTEKLMTALVKLQVSNLAFPVHDELYSMFNHSHPTLIQRLKVLSKSL